jgi:hypothetical protein
MANGFIHPRVRREKIGMYQDVKIKKTNLSYVTLLANLRTRHRSGRSRSSEDDSEESTAMTMRVSDTWKCKVRWRNWQTVVQQTLYTTPSACEAFVSTPDAEAFGFFVEVAEVTLASIRARSPGLNHLLEL